eukprot:scaffold25830_cov162-Cylindrotheca_fusiformis.AAC.5
MSTTTMTTFDDSGSTMMDMDLGSDGSDYEIMDEDISFSSDRLSEDFEPEFLPILPNPDLPDPSKISVEELQETIRKHLDNSTLKKALTQIDTSSNLFIPEFSKPSLIPRNYFSAGTVLDQEQDLIRRTPQLVKKLCGTLLHYACHDHDEVRGEQKVKLILQAAAKIDITPARICSIAEVQMVQRNGNWEELEDPDDHKEGYGTTLDTPFFILLRNRRLRPMRLLAAAWPGIVQLRDIRKQVGYGVYGETYTTLMELVYDHFRPDDDHSVDLAIVKTLLEFADKTPQGARGLVAASFRWPTGFHWQEGEDLCDHEEEHCTAIHIALSCRRNQPELIPPMIKAWPDALIYCGDMMEECGSFPLHIIWKNPPVYSDAVKATEYLLMYSTIEAVATALLNTNVDGNLGFAVVMETVPEKTPENDVLRDRLLRFLKTLVYKKDAKGRTLLHYAAAFACKPNRRELYYQHIRFCAEYWTSRGRNVGVDDDVPELPPDGIEEWEKEKRKLQRRNTLYQQDVITWILKQDPTLALVADLDGLNPFHYALSSGKTWSSGLEYLANSVPEWPERATKKGLLPYQFAATLVDKEDGDVDTIYELLKFVGTTQ